MARMSREEYEEFRRTWQRPGVVETECVTCGVTFYARPGEDQCIECIGSEDEEAYDLRYGVEPIEDLGYDTDPADWDDTPPVSDEEDELYVEACPICRYELDYCHCMPDD